MVKVSIVMPVCNVEKYLRNGLDSVVGQTLNEIELICVDDCSTDSSAEILKEYMQKDERIKCIFHETNLGTSQARKDGVKISTGKYVMFLDGDDELTADACEKAYRAIERYKTDMVQFDTEIINCAGMPEARIQSNQKALYPYMEKITENNLLGACWRENSFGYTLWNKIYNGEICRKSFDEVEDGYYPKAQDLYAFFIMAYYSKSYIGIKDQLYCYNFGFGVTGGENIPLKKYDILLTEKHIWEALTRFIKMKKEEELYEDILSDIYNHFLIECVNRWKNNLSPECTAEGFEHLVQKWGFDEVLCKMAENSWFDRVKVAQKMLETNYFSYVKRGDKKVKTIATYYRSINNGGAQRVVAMLCNIWAEMKDEEGNYLYNVVLITDEAAEETDYELNTRVAREYIFHHAECAQQNYRYRFQDWNRILEKYDIDVVITSMWVSPCTVWDMLTVKGFKTKPAFLVHSHSFCCMPYRNSISLAMEVMSNYQLCDGVVCLSECDKRLASSFSGYAKYITNPLTFSVKEFPKQQYEDKSIVWVGRISVEKNPKDAVQMMSYVVKEIPDAKLYIVGSGNEALCESVIDLIQSLGLENNVIMTGFSSDVSEYYKKAAVSINTSEYEGFPLTYCEAMSHAVPIVSYELPWLTFSRDGRGMIEVPHKRYDLLAKEVVTLLQNPEIRNKMGKAGWEQISEVAAIDIGKEWSDFFDGLDRKEETEERTVTTEDIIFKYLTLYQDFGKKVARDNAKKAEINNAQKKIKKLEKQIKNLETSTTFRIGKIIMFIPVSIKKLCKKLLKKK